MLPETLMMGNPGIPNPGICQRLLLQNEHDYGQQLYFCYSPRKSDAVATAVAFFFGGEGAKPSLQLHSHPFSLRKRKVTGVLKRRFGVN